MNLYEHFRRQVRTRPDATAVARADGADLTYEEVDRQARQVAALVDEVTRGVDATTGGPVADGTDDRARPAGDPDDTDHPARVALYLGNSPAYLPAVLGVWHAGRAVVPLNVMLSVGELADVLGDVRPSAMLLSDTFVNNARELAERVDSLGDGGGAAADGRGDGAAEDRVATVDADGGFHPDPFPDPGAAPDPATRLDCDLAVVMHTSGTTGRPKGVVQTHRNVAAQVEAGVSRCRVTPDDTTLVPVPLFHVGGLHGGVLMALFSGAAVSIQPWWDPAEWARRVEATGATMSGLVSTMVVDAVDSDAAREHDTSSLRLCIYGGSATPEATLSAFEEAFDVDSLSDFYGLTEVSGLAVTYDAGEQRREGSMGRLVPAVEGRVVDVETGTDLPAGEEGELLLRGDTVTPGYWERPDLTDGAFEEPEDDRGRWLHTGDVVQRDEEGYLSYVERVDDLILSGGEKVAPSRVEAVLAEMPAVASAAVVGTPHDRLGEAVTAAVVPADDADDLSVADVLAFCEGHEDLAGYKEPRRVEVVESLPRTGTRKVDRAALREELG